MRGELIIDEVPVKMVNNRVLVIVKDIFSGFKTQSGIDLVNLTMEDTWGDSKEYTFSEFAMRRGIVLAVPETISYGSFNYRTKPEIKKYDVVFWSLASFQGHIPLKYKNSLLFMVDYHEILARNRDGEITPVNGFALFSPVGEKKKFLDYTVENRITDMWTLEKMPELFPEYHKNSRQPSDIWKVGDRVKLLVRQSPYKLEGYVDTSLKKELYACPVNYIICTC